MNPVTFPQANATYGPPKGYSTEHCLPTPAYHGQIKSGPFDGSVLVVVAWKPAPEEIDKMLMGEPMFLGMIGGLAPHFITMDADKAVNFS